MAGVSFFTFASSIFPSFVIFFCIVVSKGDCVGQSIPEMTSNQSPFPTPKTKRVRALVLLPYIPLITSSIKSLMLSSAIVASSVVSSERAITRHLVGFAREGSSQRMHAMRCAHNGCGFEDFADATLRAPTRCHV